MNPVQLPLHEPYFDLTLIRAAHTRNPTIRSKSFYLRTYNKIANLLRKLLSACDEWLVPIRGGIHRDMVIHDYQQFLIHAAEFQATIHFLYFILFFEISSNSHFCVSLWRRNVARLQPTILHSDQIYHTNKSDNYNNN